MANRETEPASAKEDIDDVFSTRQIDDLLTLATELRTDLNSLRQDFRRHDHGVTASYAATTMRINGTNNTFSGSAETSSDVAGAVPQSWAD